MGSSISNNSNGLHDKKNCTTKNLRGSEYMIKRIFPWLQNSVTSKMHDVQHVKLITAQTTNRNLSRESTFKETKVWSHIVEKV